MPSWEECARASHGGTDGRPGGCGSPSWSRACSPGRSSWPTCCCGRCCPPIPAEAGPGSPAVVVAAAQPADRRAHVDEGDDRGDDGGAPETSGGGHQGAEEEGQ